MTEDFLFRDQVTDRLARLETKQDQTRNELSVLNLNFEALRMTIMQQSSEKRARTLLARTAGHLITGCIAAAAAIVAAMNGFVPHTK